MGFIGQFLLSMAPAILKWVLGLFMSKDEASKVAARVIEYIQEYIKITSEKAGKMLKAVRKTSAEVERDRQELINKHKDKG